MASFTLQVCRYLISPAALCFHLLDSLWQALVFQISVVDCWRTSLRRVVNQGIMVEQIYIHAVGHGETILVYQCVFLSLFNIVFDLFYPQILVRASDLAFCWSLFSVLKCNGNAFFCQPLNVWLFRGSCENKPFIVIVSPLTVQVRSLGFLKYIVYN